jgi:ATP-dependent Clp protease ATP-binding subunit ClpB
VADLVRHIVDLQIDRVGGRLAIRGLTLDVTPEARDLIARMGYDPAFGARPLKRVIRRELEDRVAKALLAGDASEGAVVRVDASGDDLTLDVAA